MFSPPRPFTISSGAFGAAVVLLPLLLSQLGQFACSRTLAGHNEVQYGMDRMNACAVRRDGYSYKPRGDGDWEQKYDGLDECFAECSGRYDVIVHNTRTDKCYCWKVEAGQLERTAGDDNTYDITRCGSGTRQAAEETSEREEESSSSSSEARDSRGDDVVRTGGGALPAECIRKYEDYTYKPQNGGNWERKFNKLDTCLRECRGEYEVIVHNRRTRDCYCWRLDDGNFERSSGYDEVYLIDNCYNEGSNRAGGDENPPLGWSFGVDEVEYCVEEEADLWTIFDKYVCSGTADFTATPGYIVQETDPYDDDDYDVTRTWIYDGRLEQCQELFSLDYWDTLLNPEVRLRSGSWYTHNGDDGTCRLYTNNDSCSRLTYDGADSSWHSAKYCNFWSK